MHGETPIYRQQFFSLYRQGADLTVESATYFQSCISITFESTFYFYLLKYRFSWNYFLLSREQKIFTLLLLSKKYNFGDVRLLSSKQQSHLLLTTLLLKTVLFCGAYVGLTLPQRLRDISGCKDCYVNENILTYLLTYVATLCKCRQQKFVCKL